MSQIKISQLPDIASINANTQLTVFAAVDLANDTTGQISAQTLAAGLYSNAFLVVGPNQIALSNTAAQFSNSDPAFVQVNLQNFNSAGSGDYVITVDNGTQSGGYIDLGINNSQWNPVTAGQTSQYPYDGYLIVDGIGTSPTGNLVLGTANPSTNVVFAVGGYSASNIVAKMTATGLTLNTQSYIVFGDGSKQNTAYIGPSGTANSAASFANGAFTLANNTVGVDATQNTNIISAQSFANSAFTKANSAVQNTAVIQLQALTLTGNLIANSVGQGIFVDTFTSNSATFSKNVAVLGNLTANTLLGNIFFSNVTSITTQANSILWTVQSGIVPQQTGQLWYSSNTQSLILDTDVVGDRPSISKVLFFRAYNNTGASIASNSFVRLTGGITSNLIPYIALADATNAANATVAGFVSNSIANGAYGFVYSSGLVENFNASGLGVGGDVLYLSASPGQSSNVAPTGSNTVVQVARVLSNDPVYGKISVQIQLRQAYGRPNGSVLYAYANNIVSSNTLSINDATGYMNANNIIANNITVINETITGTVNANTLIANTMVYGSATANSGVTQLSSKSTAVTANGISGQITMNNATLNSGTGVTFTVNNSYVQHVYDMVFVSFQNAGSGNYQVCVANTRVGSFDVNVYNGATGPSGNRGEALVLNWSLIRVGN